MRHWFPMGLLLLGGACATATGGARPGQPDATSDRWRILVGCYQLQEGQFALDSVPETRPHANTPGVRRARFAPRPPIVGGSWFVTDRGVVWVFRNDGLWGMSYEMTARGDTLVGRRWTGTDVPGRGSPPNPVVEVRTAACQAQPAPAAQSSR